MAARAGSGGLSRRALLLSGGATTLVACTPAPPPEPAATHGAVAAHGAQQAGVTRPAPAQRFLEVRVYDCADVVAVLAGLGEQIVALTAAAATANPELADVSVTVGVGDATARTLWGDAGAVGTLPAFARDALSATDTGGELLLQLGGSSAAALTGVGLALEHWLANRGGTLRWGQEAFREDQHELGYSRNLTGFHDGIINPRSAEELGRGVWAAAPAHSTVMVLRRLRIDLGGFLALSDTTQERLIGREKFSGAPLSGGGTTDEVSLFAKDPAGNYLVPLGAHAREAHPAGLGAELMLRRGYAYTRGPAERGHLFISFQADPAVFIKTQQHLDAADGFMRYVSCTGSGIFRILPGFTAERPLGTV